MDIHLIWGVECHSVSTLTHLNTSLNTQLHSKLLPTLSYLSLYNNSHEISERGFALGEICASG